MRLPSRRVGPVLLALVGIVAVAIALTSSSGGRIPDGSGGSTVVRSEPDGTIRAHHCAKHSEVGEDPRCPGDRRSFQRWREPPLLVPSSGPDLWEPDPGKWQALDPQQDD